MTESERYCFGGGSIIGAREWLPDDPVEYDIDIPTPKIGCNRLVCGSCGASVRSWANMATNAWGDVNAAALYAYRRDGLPSHFEADDSTRTYACACVWTQTHTSQVLGIEAAPGASLFSSQWRCAGHPEGELPKDLRAILGTVDETTLESGIETLLGTRSVLRTSRGEPFLSPCLDVWRLEAHLPPGLSVRVRTIVRRQLASSVAPSVLQATLSYLKLHAVPEDGHAWLAAIETSPTILDVESPDYPGHDLRREGAPLLEVLSDHEAENHLQPSQGLVEAFFDYFEHQGLNFRLTSIARLALGAVLNEITMRQLALKPHNARALQSVWSELRVDERRAAREAWATGSGLASEREALLAALPKRVARGISSA